MYIAEGQLHMVNLPHHHAPSVSVYRTRGYDDDMMIANIHSLFFNKNVHNMFWCYVLLAGQFLQWLVAMGGVNQDT